MLGESSPPGTGESGAAGDVGATVPKIILVAFAAQRRLKVWVLRGRGQGDGGADVRGRLCSSFRRRFQGQELAQLRRAAAKARRTEVLEPCRAE